MTALDFKFDGGTRDVNNGTLVETGKSFTVTPNAGNATGWAVAVSSTGVNGVVPSVVRATFRYDSSVEWDSYGWVFAGFVAANALGNDWVTGGWMNTGEWNGLLFNFVPTTNACGTNSPQHGPNPIYPINSHRLQPGDVYTIWQNTDTGAMAVKLQDGTVITGLGPLVGGIVNHPPMNFVMGVFKSGPAAVPPMTFTGIPGSDVGVVDLPGFEDASDVFAAPYMPTNIDRYTNLITSEHNKRPNFMASVAATIQGPSDLQSTLNSMLSLYDIDAAVGDQLDKIGEWIGISRVLKETIGSPFNISSLDDAHYRILLFATIAANQWDGTVPGAYEIWSIIFAPYGLHILIQDNQDMSMELTLYGGTPDALTLAMFTGGYLSLKPAGVAIAAYLIPSIPSVPMFGFDIENDVISGFDVGAWATIVTP